MNDIEILEKPCATRSKASEIAGIIRRTGIDARIIGCKVVILASDVYQHATQPQALLASLALLGFSMRNA